MITMLGTTRMNSLGQPYYIEAKLSKEKYIIEFKNTGTRLLANQSSVSTGRIKDPYAPFVCGIGYKGEGFIDDRIYDVWFDLLRRVTGKHEDKSTRKLYKDVTIDTSWLNFQNFQKWFRENNYIIGLHVIDKDLSGYRRYGPETSHVVPYFVNMAIMYNKITNKKKFFGIAKHGDGWYSELTTILREYKVFHSDDEKAFFCYVHMKEYYIKVLANQCLLKCIINLKTYDALHKYKIKLPESVEKPSYIDEYIENLYKNNYTFKIFINDMKYLIKNKIDHICAQRLSKANRKNDESKSN